MYFNFRTVGCLANNVKKLFAITRYFDSGCNQEVNRNIFSYILHR